MKTIPLSAIKINTGQAREIRQEKRIPAVIYGKDFKNVYLSLDYQEFKKAYEKAGESTIVEINLDAKKIPVLIHEIQYDSVKDTFMHIDFQAIRMDQEIHTFIPIHLEGESPAVKLLHGIVNHQKESIEVRCLPKDLISEIKVDISKLENFHDKIIVESLNLPDVIKILDHLEDVIVTITPPQVEKEEAPAGETVADEVKQEEKA